MYCKLSDFVTLIAVCFLAVAVFPVPAAAMETMLKVAFEPNLPPYQFMEEGSPSGIHVELLNKIAADNNYLIEYIPLESTARCIEALESGDVDMVLGVSTNDKEKYKEQLTESISQSYICIVATRQNAYKIKNDIDVTSFIVALQNNTIGYSYIRNLRNLRYVVTSNQIEAFDLLTSGKTDLLVGVKHSILYQMEESGIAEDYTIVNDYIVPIEYCVAVKSGNRDLLDRLNEEIKNLKIKGDYERIQRRWINENADAVREVIRQILKVAAVVLLCVLVVIIFNLRLNFLLKKQVSEKTARLNQINLDLQNQIVQTRNHNELKNCIVENSPSGIVVFNTSCRITLANNNVMHMIGDEKDLMDRKITDIDFFDRILADKMKDIFAEQMLFTNQEATVRGNEGEDIIYRYDVYPLYNSDGDIRGAILMIDDVTEEVHLKEQLYEKDKNRALNQIVAGIAHEIRNPLTAIKTFVELMPLKKDNERFQQRICTVVPREVDRVSNLIKNLMDYARPDNGNKDKTNVSDLILQSIELMWHLIKNQKIILNKNIEPGINILVDSNQIKQVLINIILNGTESMMAVKSGNESLFIDIRAWQDEDFAYIQIMDDGEGMSREEIKKCTEPFFTTKKSGTGLGMYVSKQYVEQNDGELMIESEKNVYTKITLKFRRA